MIYREKVLAATADAPFPQMLKSINQRVERSLEKFVRKSDAGEHHA